MSDFTARYDPGVQVDADEVLCLHRNENLFVGRDWSVDTARELIERAGISSYPDATSLPVREALAEVYGVGPENVFVGNGSDEVLADLFDLLRADYDTLHCLDVCFKVYPMLAERIGYATATLPGDTFESGRIDTAGFRGLAVVDSPNGISGARVDAAEVLQLAADERSFLIWDNVYGEYAGEELPAPLPRNVAFVRSFSKFYGLAGLRIGYCIADAELVARLLARKDAFNVNGLAQVMAVEALRRRAEFAALRDRLTACRARLIDGLLELGFRVKPSETVAVLATHPELSGERLQAELLERGIAVRRFADPPLADYVRATVPPEPLLERLLATLRAILEAAPSPSERA